MVAKAVRRYYTRLQKFFPTEVGRAYVLGASPIDVNKSGCVSNRSVYSTNSSRFVGYIPGLAVLYAIFSSTNRADHSRHAGGERLHTISKLSVSDGNTKISKFARPGRDRPRGGIQAYYGLRLRGFPIANKKMALLLFACGEKNSITSSSKKVKPVAPSCWAYAARYILPPIVPASSWTAR